VALLEDMPGKRLTRGQVGTVVETGAPVSSKLNSEVEFADDEGRAYAMVALRADQVVRLHYEPKGEAA
jgi:hypothetical protein